MRASHQLKYAIYGVFDLAYHGADRPTPVQEIGERQGIPGRYLEQIFQRLRRAGLVVSKRGPGGGYQLGRSPAEITLADVVRAVEGELLSWPEEGNGGAKSPEFVWAELVGGLERAFAARTVADLCREAAERGMTRARAAPAMYQI